MRVVMKQFTAPLPLAIGASIALTSFVPAATLVTYVPTGGAASNPNDSPINATFTDSQLSASVIGNIGTSAPMTGLGSGSSGPIRATNGSWTFGGGGWLFANTGTDGANGTASSTTDYFNFTLSTPGQETLSLTNLTFNYGVGSNATGVTSNFYYAVFASVNGGAFTQLGSTFDSGSLSLTQNATTNLGLQTINLSSISGVDSVEFRVWVSSTFGNGNTGAIFQNISVDGAVVPVPEPSITMLGGLGALALLRRRRN